MVKNIKGDLDLKNIPERFLIAGGYTLGLVLQYLGIINESKHRDIDIFYDVGYEDEDKDVEEFISKMGDCYAFYCKSDDYEILTQWKKDNLNFIKITSGAKFSWNQFIKDFDLNCVFIGVEKDNDGYRLIYSDEFIDFLHTKEIKLFDKLSYLSSIPRALRKIEQYPFLKFDFYYFFKRMIINETNFFQNKKVNYPNFLSKENREVLKNIINKVDYCELDSEETGFYVRISRERDYFKYYKIFKDLFDANAYPFLKKNEIERIKRISKILIDESNKDVNKYYKNNLLKIIFLNYNLIYSDFKKEDLLILGSFLFKHYDRRNSFEQSILHIMNQVGDWKSFIFFIRQLRKNNSLIAFIENKSIIKERVSSYDRLVEIKHIDDIKNNQNSFNYKNMNLLGWLEKYVTELSYEKDLIDESKKMKHCVSGYWKYVKNGSQRIFHIKYKDNHSTLSLDYKSGVIKQHKSIRNKNPHKINSYLGEILSKNYKYLLK
jgi:hypothetical protein